MRGKRHSTRQLLRRPMPSSRSQKHPLGGKDSGIPGSRDAQRVRSLPPLGVTVIGVCIDPQPCAVQLFAGVSCHVGSCCLIRRPTDALTELRPYPRRGGPTTGVRSIVPTG